ncbi:hypothetical protein PS673_03148 [Pseudomonas fluorescens]|uniref:Uncharacterized protein n=1 Tax=Pseudomonas fluorescens TaxID=294 RepID=A0A5E6TXW1_PSEFL|nr:hypothetical protein PS673_03148 [Pseudomonas fluorescens]
MNGRDLVSLGGNALGIGFGSADNDVRMDLAAGGGGEARLNRGHRRVVVDPCAFLDDRFGQAQDQGGWLDAGRIYREFCADDALCSDAAECFCFREHTDFIRAVTVPAVFLDSFYKALKFKGGAGQFQHAVFGVTTVDVFLGNDVPDVVHGFNQCLFQRHGASLAFDRTPELAGAVDARDDRTAISSGGAIARVFGVDDHHVQLGGCGEQFIGGP